MDQPVAMSIADVSVAAMIDDEIMRAAKERWQKVAMITAIIIHANPRRGIKDTAIAERIKLLVSLGKLEAQGNLDRMRYSEVRLPPR
ncbi:MULTISPECIES: DUF3658 domain-containing protein [Methylobacterium]|nr:MULTISPECIES: DUF3658 domain-containing protein [Methylobacterium]TXM68158.1 hypothetical protein FV226_20505 [Methylobacterium sp. WL12]TXM91504.1 hypothetical protein FV219_21115 [Methylobacterium sp. WL122]TXN84015.1 hypothetical protein FV234_04715 [Methylobacterium sp. WL8]